MSNVQWVLSDSETNPCCCISCAGEVYGEEIVATQSGIVSCGCIATGPEFSELQNLIIPASFTLVWNGSSFWISDLDGSGDLYIGPDCESLEFFQSGQFRAFAECGEGTDLNLTISFVYDNGGSEASIIVYFGTFSSLGSYQPNTQICGDPGVLGGDGDVSI